MGIDLVEIPRIKRMMERYAGRVLERLLTEGERAYCVGKAFPEQHVAARVAAKEASYKALQAAGGAAAVSWLDIEVVLDPTGRPSVVFHGLADDAARRLSAKGALISLTHSTDTAAAIVILTG